MRLTFDMPDHHTDGSPYPWELEDVVSYLFIPITKERDGSFIAPYCVGIGNSDPDPREEFVQTKMEPYYSGIRQDIFKFLEEVNAGLHDKFE
jgi:hypothetical protein